MTALCDVLKSSPLMAALSLFGLKHPPRALTRQRITSSQGARLRWRRGLNPTGA
jgi:hypothetical protein